MTGVTETGTALLCLNLLYRFRRPRCYSISKIVHLQCCPEGLTIPHWNSLFPSVANTQTTVEGTPHLVKHR